MKIALVHEFLRSMRGGERVILAFHEIWPEAPIYTFNYNPENMPEFKNADVRPSFLNKWKFAQKHHEFFAIARIFTFGSKKIKNVDLILSSASAEAKYVKKEKRAIHICYCHTPTRYYWSDYERYRANPPFGVFNPLAKVVLTLLIGWLRKVDYKKAQKVDYFIANSNFVKARIKKYYNRDADVIYPPVETSRFSISPNIGEYYLLLGQLVWYKRPDIVIDAFNELGLPLRVMGEGSELEKLKARAKPNIEFLGRLSDEEVAKNLSGCRALIFPQVEDFGIVPLEAMASGRPVIAYAEGGALESVVSGVTGEFFHEQTPDSLMEAVKNFDLTKFDSQKIRNYALTFDTDRFKEKIKKYCEEKLAKPR